MLWVKLGLHVPLLYNDLHHWLEVFVVTYSIQQLSYLERIMDFFCFCIKKTHQTCSKIEKQVEKYMARRCRQFLCQQWRIYPRNAISRLVPVAVKTKQSKDWWCLKCFPLPRLTNSYSYRKKDDFSFK